MSDPGFVPPEPVLDEIYASESAGVRAKYPEPVSLTDRFRRWRELRRLRKQIYGRSIAWW